MTVASNSKLFAPVRVGDLELRHRVVLAPMTRLRVKPSTNVILPIVSEFYQQRASTPGTLLISEGAFHAHAASPGIWSEAHIAAWRNVTDAVHKQGSFIYCQLFAMGRAATTPELAHPGVDFDLVSASAIPLPGETITPRELTVEEIHEYVSLFVTAAENAVHKAGFDGVEIHAANGYLLDAFLQDTANRRTDAYGGSPENRARLLLEVVSATSKVIDESKVGVRISPWSPFQGMLMEDPVPTFTHVVQSLLTFPRLAYLHIVEPRTEGAVTVEASPHNVGHSNDFIRSLWRGRTLIAAGGYTRRSALAAAERGELIAFGRPFLANPDLPLRLVKNIPLTRGDRSTYYVSTTEPEGYTSYPFAS
ncbi:hypothetical protein C8R44DRAFT_613292 [Mycena epipterygia]|nr:hypothetical protein C8R44DRAFT_613292 [Mycena epipterygia]